MPPRWPTTITLRPTWTPLGTSADPFTGTFTGNAAYSIDGLTISGRAQYAGLFGYADGATLTDIKLDDVDIDISRSASSYAGGLVGKAVDTDISRCEVQSGSDIDVVLTGGGAYVGGLAGVYRGTDASISGESLANATISVSGATSSVYAGGLVGYHRGEGDVLSLSECAAGESVTVTGSSTIYGGGLVGYFYIGTSTDDTEVLAERCCASGDVDIESSGGTEYAGGTITVDNCFATGVADATNASTTHEGGLAGYNGTATHTNCWWYNATNGSAVSSGSSSGISKADAKSDFYDDDHDVYEDWGFGGYPPSWVELVNALPVLYWQT